MKNKKFVIFGLIKKEPSHLFWFVYTIFFGLINIWAALLTGNLDSMKLFISSGNLYTFSISICAPLCFNLLINFIKTKKSRKICDKESYNNTSKHYFLSYIMFSYAS